MAGGQVEKPVDMSRREFLKAAAVVAGASAVSFLAVGRDELKKVLVPVRLEDLLAEAEESESELERKARRKEEELKKRCLAYASRWHLTSTSVSAAAAAPMPA